MDQGNVTRTQVLAEDIRLRKPGKANDTYGTICFQGFGSEASRNVPYVRVCVPNGDIDNKAKNDAKKVWKLMKCAWEVPSPQLIISVTGGAQDFYLNQRLLNGFKRGLISLATTAGAWIITGGTKTGVMEMVGEAAREHMLKNNLPEQNIVLLGVVDWNMVANNQCLISTAKPDVLYECHYKVNYEQSAPGFQQQQPTVLADYTTNAATVAANKNMAKQSFLDPFHTHFVLVDSGTDEYGGEIKFRAYLEKQIAKHAKGPGEGTRVPTVLLVLEGGKETLLTVLEAIKRKVAVVVIAGSGRAANLIAYALENKNRWNHNDDACIMKTAEILDVKFDPTEPPCATSTNYSLVSKCAEYVDNLLKMEYEKLLVIYKQADEEIQHGIDVAVIKALIGAQRHKSTKSDIANQLKLALAWNRADIAETEILNVRKREEWEEILYPVLFEALVHDKDTFVQTLLDTGVNLGDFLTKERLTSLYHDVEKTNSGTSVGLLQGLINNAKKHCCYGNSCCYGSRAADHGSTGTFTLENVGELIKELINDNRPDMYRKYDTKFEQPERELFLWALLLKRKNLALTFWRLGSDHVGSALFASVLSKSLAEAANQEEELDLADQFRADSSEYEALATGILDECYLKDKMISHILLTRNLDRWGNRTLFALANDFELMDFMGTSCCQTLLNEIWMGRMALSTPMWKFPSCLPKSIRKFKRVFPESRFFYLYGICTKPFNYIIVILISLIVPFGCLTIGYTEGELETPHNADEPTDNGNTDHAPSQPAANGDNGDVKQDSRETKDVKRRKRRLMRWTNSFYSFYYFFHCFYYYFTAPVVNFCYFTIAYLVFLGLFSFCVLTNLVPGAPSLYEYIVLGWALTMFIEELRQFLNDEFPTFKKKLKAHFRSYWNRLDLVVYVLLVISVILRYTLPASSFVWAQMFYVSTLSLYFIRFLQVFYVGKNIGPKVLAIQRMLYDLALFLLILAVFLLAFGIGSHALLYPNSPATWSILYNVVSRPYFNIFGDINMDEYLGQVAGCSYNATIYENDPSIPQCSVENALVYIMLAIYMLLVNILLINLLIAMFSYTFSNVQENSGTVWRFYRYELVYEYFDKPPLPPPLIIISHTWMLIKLVYRKYKAHQKVKPDDSPSMSKPNTDFKQYLRERENDFLTAFERDSVELYFLKRRQGEKNQTEYKMNIANQKIDRAIAQMDQTKAQGASSHQQPSMESSAVHCNCIDTKVRLEQLEKQMSQQSELLQLQQVQLGSIIQSLNNLTLTNQVAAPAQFQHTVADVVIRDLDFGSSTS